jgi:HSP20 family protein
MFKNPFSKPKIKNQEEEYLFPPEQIKSINEKWLEKEYEGELAVDVYEANENIVIKSTVAGVKPENLNIIINNDMVTIRGKREVDDPQIKENDYLYKECYWGGFSRSIVLPTNVKTDKVKATLKSGLLTVVLPKISKNYAIKIKEEI